MKKPTKYGVDVAPVTSDEALEFMSHHLSLAASYYEATSGNEDANLKEMKRLLSSQIEGYESPTLKAAIVWFETMRKCYNEYEDKDEEPTDPKPN
jgi:hypothetical protein